MSEHNAEVPTRTVGTSGLSLRQKIGRAAAIAGAVGAGFLGVDKEAKPVRAADHTPTRTPTAAVTGTATPTTADLRATRTALETQLPDLQARATEQARIDALQEEFDVLRGTPTKTPTPTPTRSPADATATADAIRLKALGEEQARIKAADATRTAPSATPTPTPSPRPVLTPTPVSGGKEGELPLGELAVIGGGALALLGLFSRRVRNGIRNGFRRLTRRGPHP